MNDAAIVRWLEHKRRTDRVTAAILSVLALGCGAVVFVLTALFVYLILRVVVGVLVHFTVSAGWVGLAAFGVTGAVYFRFIKTWRPPLELNLDPLGFWIFKDIGSIGPRLMLEGLREIRICALLGELNVAGCARALAYLAEQERGISWEELLRHCPELSPERLREQLSLLDGVLFLGDDELRVTLMEPFRLRLRWMLGVEWERERERRQAQEQSERRSQGSSRAKAKPRARPESESTPSAQPASVSEPEKLSPYEILGVSSSASVGEIKAAYRKRIKECHPDLFAGMDSQARTLAERWTKALNAAYAILNPRNQGGVRARSARQA